MTGLEKVNQMMPATNLKRLFSQTEETDEIVQRSGARKTW